MNFIQLAQATRKRAGLQGAGPSSVSTTGFEAALIALIQDAWTDVQNYRKDWKWMRSTSIFLMTIGKSDYTLGDIFGVTYRHKYWLKGTMYALINGQYTAIRFVEYDTFIERTQNDTTTSPPSIFTIRPNDSALLFNSPDSDYTIKVDYQKSPQILEKDADVPELPVHYHSLIVYASLEKYAIYLENGTLFSGYALEYAKLMNTLMRDQLPKKVLNIRGIV